MDNYAKIEKSQIVVNELEKLYPDAYCALNYSKPYELLIAARLSAQCTDARVNIITKTLFKKYKTIDAFANADLNELEDNIKSCGLYKTKSKSIKDMAIKLLNEYGGEIPDNMDDLLKLPGIGRKTANLIMGDVYGKPAIVTDTHFIRITNRLGLTENQEPYKVEMDLKALISPEKSSDFCHRVVLFGRDICKARKPECQRCPLTNQCNYFEHLVN